MAERPVSDAAAAGTGGERIDRAAIAATEARIRPYVRRTPLLEVAAEDFGLAGLPLTLKLEFLQHSGSFKARGAFANLLLRPVPEAGVVAASGGNHGAAVAHAARALGVRARIFVPSIASPAKIARIEATGAELVVGGALYADALAAAEACVAETGALAVHAYDQRETLLGQGTTGLELEAQAPELDTLLVAVGGGGLIGGIAADSLAPRQVGQLMFPIAQRAVERVVLVPDEAIAEAQAALWRTLRVASEPGGATAFAALLSGAYRPSEGERVGVLLCGANTHKVDL